MQAFKQKVSKKVSLPSSATICSCTPQKYYIFRKLPNNFATFFQQNAKKKRGRKLVLSNYPTSYAWGFLLP
jgi:hypothetical protein